MLCFQTPSTFTHSVQVPPVMVTWCPWPNCSSCVPLGLPVPPVPPLHLPTLRAAGWASQPRKTLVCPWRAEENSGDAAPKACSLRAKGQTLPHGEISWSEIFSGKRLGNKSFEVSGSDLHHHVALLVIQTA